MKQVNGNDCGAFVLFNTWRLLVSLQRNQKLLEHLNKIEPHDVRDVMLQFLITRGLFNNFD